MPLRIGRAKAVTTFSVDQYVGLITEVTAKIPTEKQSERIRFPGPVRLDDRAREQLFSILIPLVDQIASFLGLPERNYEVSGVNLASAASFDRGIAISGYSADLPIFLALLSTTLGVAIRQDVACTGHIASAEGDIRPVRGISQKIQAAVAASGISAIVIPDLGKDRSFEVLTPVEYESAMESIARHKSHLQIHVCGDIRNAVEVLMPDESIVLGSLISGFFGNRGTGPYPENPIYHTVRYLAEGNEKRFWFVLEKMLLDCDFEKARSYLQAYADFHIRNKCYPKYLGEQLSKLLISLPPSVSRLKNIFPLVQTDLVIRLSQMAGPEDHSDVRQVYKASFGEGLEATPRNPKAREPHDQPADETEALLYGILNEISEENLADLVKPLDEARSRYASSQVTVADGFEFNEAVTAFYTHLYRHMTSPAGPLDKSALSTEALELVEKAFRKDGGYKGALSEALQGIHGGMRKVFDIMTEYWKQDAKQKHIGMVFKKAIDPKNWDEKVRLMEVFMDRLHPDLPIDLKGMPPRLLASHWEEVISHYSESIAKLKDFMRTL
jgi:hypothetical protein